MANLERILHFLEEAFEVSAFPDYPHALNGLQVQGPEEVQAIGAAVDASEATISEAVRQGVQLLLVHHGLFWGGLGPITGPRYRKVSALIEGKVGLYGLHLPLDAHPELGNNALVLKALDMKPEGRFGSYKDVEVGWWARAELGLDELVQRLAGVVEGDARAIPGGPEVVRKLGVLTGAGASSLEEAASQGLDTLITGEAPHHSYHEAMELGLNLILAGHYATETFGVKALANKLAREFGVSWTFLHFPTGL
jgi:dinuclear metal center YbgI/SA1388 family protein